MPVGQLSGIIITVADLAGMAAFYREALGFAVEAQQPADRAWLRLLGVEEGTTARSVDVPIGRQTLKLMAFDPPGFPYPSPRASNDQWFQHLALVCGGIEKVWQRLSEAAAGAVTEGAPVLLPANTGGVIAFKFRDPEGHPLELIAFPRGTGDPVWQNAGNGIAGYDHTAISVMDIDRSIAFYTGLLGFRLAGRTLNQGPEQDRLDGLTGCEVDVVALEPALVATPHVELLHYRSPRGRTLASPVRANDVAAVCQIHRADDLDMLVRRLEAEHVTFVSSGIVTLRDGGKAAAIRDPDGHIIVLTE
ncbi:MAG: VOC family protein [Pseudorhodoplanes sp.]|uniref:VOC family protein n=1 Tax=Pseudorhodoplanes sp. TaxID=1934341 RepID=UPI003D0BC7E1